jgi:hypothetical protein
MQIVYKAFDGTEFYYEEDCHKYEQGQAGQIRMWDREGVRIHDPNKAFFVFFYDETEAEKFVKLCEDAGAEYTGLTAEDIGFWFWDEWDNKYVYFDTQLAVGMHSVLEQMGKI